MLTSLGLHVLVLGLLMLVPAQALMNNEPKKNKQLDIVFYRPPAREIPVSAVLPPLPKGKIAAAAGPPPGMPAPALIPKPNAAPGPEMPGRPELPPGPEVGLPVIAQPQPQPKVGTAGILAFKDQIASVARDKVAPRLGTEARFGAADEVGKSSSRSTLTTGTPGSSGGINTGTLNRSVGGGGGGRGGGGGGGGGGGAGNGGAGGRGGGGAGGDGVVQITRANSVINTIGGSDRPKSNGGPGPSRTDEEIQIVFDKYKAAFYRLYNRELRNNPTLQGQMVLRLTIEPDGSVSMCKLQSTDMNAPDLATQVVDRVKTINFGAKEGVQALTIVYPIDFLPASL
jgi:hypothetical protein